MKLHTIQDAEAALAAYVPVVKQVTGKNITVGRITELLDAVGNPQERLTIVHIAGTSGKTSTAYYLANLLRASGKTVGLTVSPHVDSVAERLQINGQPVAEEEFCTALGEFLELIEDFQPQPSYFELLIALAFWYFDRAGVGYAVIETGAGGLHDGTNVAHRADKVCVITDIGLDHMHILGNTVEEIAVQKAGIMHPGNVALMYRQSPSVTQVFIDYARQQQADLRLQEQAELAAHFATPALSVLPLYQQRNWLLARAAGEYLAHRDKWQLDEQTVTRSLHVQVPGRMDVRHIGNKTVMMDGAHNEQKIEAFVKSFQRDYPHKQVPLLVALKQGKEYETVLPLLQPICSQLILTTFDLIQDLPAKAIDPAILAQAASDFGFPATEVIADPEVAFRKLLSLPDELVVVTGSFYLLSCIRPLIMET